MSSASLSRTALPPGVQGAGMGMDEEPSESVDKTEEPSITAPITKKKGEKDRKTSRKMKAGEMP